MRSYINFIDIIKAHPCWLDTFDGSKKFYKMYESLNYPHQIGKDQVCRLNISPFEKCWLLTLFLDKDDYPEKVFSYDYGGLCGEIQVSHQPQWFDLTDIVFPNPWDGWTLSDAIKALPYGRCTKKNVTTICNAVRGTDILNLSELYECDLEPNVKAHLLLELSSALRSEIGRGSADSIETLRRLCLIWD